MSEGFEEFVEEPVSTGIKNKILGTDNKTDWKQAGYNAVIGALMGGLYGSVGEIGRGADARTDVQQQTQETQTIGRDMNLDNENTGAYNENNGESPVYTYQDGDMAFDDVDPVERTAKINDAKGRFNLLDDDADFIEEYAAGDAYELNALQRDVPQSEWSDYERFRIDSMTGAIKKLPTFSGRAYRNLVFGKPGEKPGAYQAFLTEYSEGSVVELDAFTSTSKDPNGYAVSGDQAVHLVIDGVSGHDLSDSFSTPRQQEVIFLPGTRIRINRVTMANDGHPLIYAEEVLTGDHDLGRVSENEISDSGGIPNGETGISGRTGNENVHGVLLLEGGAGGSQESGGVPLHVTGSVSAAQEVSQNAAEDRVSAALGVLGLGPKSARGEAMAEEILRAKDPNILPDLNQSAGGLRGMHRNIVSGVAELERFAKAQKAKDKNAVNAEDLAQMSRAAGGTVDMIAEKALVDRRGDKVGESWAETVGKLTEEESRRLNLYRQHLHNIDRMSLEADAKERLQEVRSEIALLVELNPEYAGMTESELEERSHWSRLPEDDKKIISDYLALLQEERRLAAIRNKPILSYINRDGDEMPYTAEQSREEAAKMLHEHPELREQTEAAEAFHDRFMREWAVESGLMSEQQYNALRAKYPHYIQTFRVNQQGKGADSVTRKGGVNTTDPIRKAVGDISEIVPFEDAEMMQVNSIVRMARRNELFRNLYDFAKTNPKDAAPYVRILDKETLAEIDATEGFEALSEALEANAMEAKNGSYTLMAMIDGKPVKMQVSPDLYAGLQHLYGQDRSAAEEAFAGSVGKVTTGFKMLTTGLNPFFPITNLAKDLQTGYINTVSDRKTFVTYLARDVGGALHDMLSKSKDWQNFKALGGKSSGYYHNEKGFKESLALDKKALSWDTIKDFLGVVGESTESLIRFAEYKAAVRKYGDTQEGRAKAIQAAADVTVNFSRSAPMTRAAENFVPYLNASVQGLDKMVRQYKAHPVQATRRNLEMLTLTTVLLWLINKDDEDYQNLNNRTKDNYFCIPVGRAADWLGLEELGVEWDGKFLKIPKSREWGAVFSALTERFLRWVGGEDADEAFEGIAGRFLTNVIPSNPVTDNIGKTVFIDLRANKDFAGRDIVPQRLQGLSPENQYDYSTSDAGKAMAEGWNAVAGAANQLPGVNVPKLAPVQADYLIDSNLGFVGDAILAYDKDNPPTAAGVGKHVLDTLEQKFIADPRYQNGATDHFYNILHAAEVAKNDVNLEKELDSRVVTPEEKYYSLLKEHADAISDLRKQERGLLASDMDEAEREKQVLAIRDQILEIANNAPAKAQADLEAYKATYVPEISHLSDEKQEQARAAHNETGLSYDAFVRFTDDLSAYKKETKGQEKDTAADVAGILRGYSGLTDEQRDRLFSVYSENMAVNPFHVSRYEAGMDKSGLYAELTDAGKSEIRALLNDYEQDIDAGKAEAGKLDDWKAKAYTAEQEAGIAPDLYAQYRVALQIANTDGNSNYNQAEAEKAVRMLGAIGRDKQAYLFASTNSQWKKNPFGSAEVSKYEAAEKEAKEKPELLQEYSKVRDILNALVSSGSSAKSSAGSKPQKLKTLKTLDVLKPLKNLF